MGKGFGRGAKSVAVVTHAQVKAAKKAPRGLRVTRKQRRKQYRAADALDDPSSVADTGDKKPGQKKNNAPKSLSQEIAGVDFDQNVPRGKKLKSLRKNILGEVKRIRKKHQAKHEAKARDAVRSVERGMQRKQRQAALNAARAGKKV